MVLCGRPVAEVCRCAGPAMDNRSGPPSGPKDDCAEAGLVKFDLGALRLAFTTLAQRERQTVPDAVTEGELRTSQSGRPWGCTLPEDPAVYRLLAARGGRSLQRAQMATLPRLRPQEFYDIVVEVAHPPRPHPGRRRQPNHDWGAKESPTCMNPSSPP